MGLPQVMPRTKTRTIVSAKTLKSIDQYRCGTVLGGLQRSEDSCNSGACNNYIGVQQDLHTPSISMDNWFKTSSA